MAGRLVVCPTPIGNLEDVTLRVLGALRGADVVACEDTRRTRVLLERHGVTADLISYFEHNERERAAGLVRRMADGETVALVSDAGMPLVSDPGFVLVQAAIAAGIEIEVLPGASAVPTALVASGLPNDTWTFVGFLPRKRAALVELFAGAHDTLVAFESPNRIAASIGVLAEVDYARPVAVCRELTKVHEEVVRGTASELVTHFAGAKVKGEIVVVIGAAAEGDRDLDAARGAVAELVAGGAKRRVAASVVAKLTGLSANDLYEG